METATVDNQTMAKTKFFQEIVDLKIPFENIPFIVFHIFLSSNLKVFLRNHTENTCNFQK